MDQNHPQVSVVIPTRNRGASCVPALQSVLASQHPNFEVILIDQSTDNHTCLATEVFQEDPRFRYIHSSEKGTGNARNLGLIQARGETVLYTDDDCTVPEDWICKMELIFVKYPQVGVVYCSVRPYEFDPTVGYIPYVIFEENRLIRTNQEGMDVPLGAGMGVRRSAILNIGGFDCSMGPGSKFRGGEDYDLAIRAWIMNLWLYELADTHVLHNGFRRWVDGKQHSHNNWYSLGATYIKPLMCGHWRAIFDFFLPPVLEGVRQPFKALIYLQKPRGFKRLYYLLKGMFDGLRNPIDRKHMLYKTRKPAKFPVKEKLREQSNG